MSASSVKQRRILSLWLPRLPTDRIKRKFSRSSAAPASDAALSDASVNAAGVNDACNDSCSDSCNAACDGPCIVVAKQDNALRISALDDAAAALGLEVGLPLANARAVCPEIKVFDADEAADTEALHHIADWCDRFTPLVALDLPHGLFLDITGCAHLFGGEAKMLAMLCGALQRQGFVVAAAIAGTPVCARTLTRCVPGRIVAAGDEACAVKPLPVFALGAVDAITGGLRRAGLKTIGDVAARARSEIAARFGAAFTGLLEQALGQRDAPISPRKPLPEFIVEKRFAEPVATDTVIAATLAGLARTLVEAMQRQGKGARRLEASFFRTDGAVRSVAVDTGQAVTQGDVIDRLFRERLETIADPLDPGFGFDLIRLSASRTEIVVQQQRDLDPNVHDNDELAALIDRIAARIGGSRVMVHLPQGTHIPERAVAAVPAQHHLVLSLQADWPARSEGEPPLRPLRLFERPEPIKVIAQVPDGPPARFVWRRAAHAVVRAEGPERIAMEWWRAQGEMLTRDYFRVEDEAGLRFWLYRDGLYDREVVPARVPAKHAPGLDPGVDPVRRQGHAPIREPAAFSGDGEEGRVVHPNWFMHGLFA